MSASAASAQADGRATDQPSVAIVGSGPSGCYLAQALRRQWSQAPITVFDRLPSPYGLVRYGVASDHQGTKSITRQFDRLFTTEGIDFAGNIEIGNHLSLRGLHAEYDIVVLATGLSTDRELAIPGADLPQVYSAGQLTRTLTSHPHGERLLPHLGGSTVVIGTGNVAIDLVRSLAKSVDQWADSDINNDALTHYHRAPVRTITVVSRSAASAAKCDGAMLKELTQIPDAAFRIGDIDPELAKAADAVERSVKARLSALAELATISSDSPRVEIVFRFGWTPTAINGTDQVETVEFANRANDERFTVAADSVVTAIGFEFGANDNPGLDDTDLVAVPGDSARIGTGLYRTGWLRRGAQGTIPTNRQDAKAVADEIIADVAAGRIAVDPTKKAFSGLPESIQRQAVDFAGWLRINEAEIAAAPPGRIRHKFHDFADLLGHAQNTPVPQ